MTPISLTLLELEKSFQEKKELLFEACQQELRLQIRDYCQKKGIGEITNG